ncbi:MAG: GNAT family N-acetyltransferase [Candidatus Brocadiia bacterium]
MEGPRACREAEFGELISLVNLVFRAGTGQDIRSDYPLVFDKSNLRHMRIVKVGGKVVSEVPVFLREVVAHGDRFTIGIVSATATHPDHRGKGYALACLRDCVRVMEQEDCPVSVLWTLERTFPFYQHADWEAVASQGRVYDLRPEARELFAKRSFAVRRYEPRDTEALAAVMKIHDAERCRIVRTSAEYRALFSLPRITTFLANEGRETAAYLMLGQGTNKPGIIEGGGSPEALEHLVRHVLEEQHSDSPVQALVPLTQTSLGTLLAEKMSGAGRPIEQAAGVGYQMMRVNSLEKLLRGIANHLRRSSAGVNGAVRLECKESGEQVTLKFRNGAVGFSDEAAAEPVVLTRRELARLIFGPHPATKAIELPGQAGAILRHVFPYYFPVWELDHS